jgi:hypothetical protein
LINAEFKKCKKIYKKIYSWIADEFLHNDFRPIHQYVLYNLLEIQSELEEENDDDENNKDNNELKLLRKNLIEEEIEYLDNINNALFYMDYLFEDINFLCYKEFYDDFGTEEFNQIGYDSRIIELLPRDKRKELKERIKHERNLPNIQ